MTTISDQLIFSAGEDAFDLTKLKLDRYVKYEYPFITNGYSVQGIWFNSTGTKMVTADVTTDTVSYYTLSTAWDTTTALLQQSIYLLTYVNVGAVQGVAMNDDGTKLYLADSTGDAIREFTLTTAWDLYSIDVSSMYALAVNTADNLETSPFCPKFSPDGTKLYVVGNVLDTIIRYDLSTAWDLSTASRTTIRTMTQFGYGAETSPLAVFIDSTGTKLYFGGQTTDKVYQFTLSTAWDITTASYVGQVTISTNTPGITGMHMSADGTKMYTISGQSVVVYNLSTPWTVSTATFSSYFMTRNVVRSLFGLTFKPDGTRCFILDASTLWLSQHNLSTPWDITTATPVDPTGAQDFYLRNQDTAATRVAFKPDGTRFYMLGATNDTVYRYDMSTAWDISTATYVNNKSIRVWSTAPERSPTATGASGQAILSVSSATGIVVGMMVTGTGIAASNVWVTAVSGTNVTISANLTTAASGTYNFYYGTQSPSALLFKPDGTVMYESCTTYDYTFTWNLSTPWDITTATPGIRTNAITATETAIGEMVFNDDGTKVYCVGTTNDSVLQWDLTTPYDLTTRTTTSFRRLFCYGIADKVNFWLQKLTLAASAPQSMALSTDGTKLYFSDDQSDAVYQLTLATPWDISTAIQDNTKYLSLEGYNASPNGFYIDNSGTKLYTVDSGSGWRYINQWELATPWQIDTATYTGKQYNLSLIDTAVLDIFFSPDGTKAYTVGQTAVANATFGIIASQDNVHELTLSTPWDISTASLSGFFNVAQDTAPAGIEFSDDGNKMYIVGSTGDAVYQYTLATPWDISTCTYDGISKSTATEDTAPTGMYINKSGDKLYIVGGTAIANSTVNEGIGLFGSEEAVYQYSLSTPWDISTMTYDNVAFGLRPLSVTPSGVFFKPDGSEMYVMEATVGVRRIYQYPLYV